jgi:hypothetical protein
MSITSMLSSGLNGIQAGTAIVNRAGGQIARVSTVLDNVQLANSAIDQREGELQVKFGADVVKVADQLLGSLIDIRA